MTKCETNQKRKQTVLFLLKKNSLILGQCFYKYSWEGVSHQNDTNHDKINKQNPINPQNTVNVWKEFPEST